MSELIQSKVIFPFTALCFGYLSITSYKPTALILSIWF